LKRVDLDGGAVQTIAKTSSAAAAGGTWNDQNIILFSRGGNDGILRVAAGGGEPEKLITTDTAAGLTGLWPTFLPGGRHFLYLKIVGPSIAENSQLMWRALDSADERVVRNMYSKAFYSPTGHLLFRLGGPVVAQQFNASSGTVSGDPVQLLGDTVTESSRTSLALSPAGVLAHRAGRVSAVAQLWWIDRDGKMLATVGAAADYLNAVIDRASERVVANTFNPSDVWLIDSRRGTTSRMTFDPATDSAPIFSPDGRWIVFYSARQPAGIYRKASNGAAAEELVAATGRDTYPSDWSPDGRFLLYTGGTTGLWVLPMTGDRKPFPYLATPAAETDGQFSPDGRWVVYTSYETGRGEVFVQDFPSTGAKFQVSVAGGMVPRWGPSGRELHFLAPADGRLMSVDVESTPDFRLGIPRPLFQTRLMNLRQNESRRFGVGPDGTRFMMNVPVGEDALAPITVLLNWQALLPK
jgi:roadblock/LC7 domain-containing protein